jgi:hypothetical protein
MDKRLICSQCGNFEDGFSKEITGTESFSAVEHYDNYGQCNDTCDYDYYDTEFDDNSEKPFVCCSCGGNGVIELASKDEFLDYIWKHTNKKGDWSKKELPEKDRSTKTIERIVVKSLDG